MEWSEFAHWWIVGVGVGALPGIIGAVGVLCFRLLWPGSVSS